MAKSIALVIFGVVLIGYGYSVHSTDENLFQQSLDFTNENILETRDLQQETYQQRELDIMTLFSILKNIDFNEKAVTYLPKLFDGLELALKAILKEGFEKLLDFVIAPFMNENLLYVEDYLKTNLEGITLKQLLERIPADKIIRKFNNIQNDVQGSNRKTDKNQLEEIKTAFLNAYQELQKLIMIYEKYQTNHELNTPAAAENVKRRRELMQILDELAENFDSKKMAEFLAPLKEKMAALCPDAAKAKQERENKDAAKEKKPINRNEMSQAELQDAKKAFMGKFMALKKLVATYETYVADNKLNSAEAVENAQKTKQLLQELEETSDLFEKDKVGKLLTPIKEKIAKFQSAEQNIDIAGEKIEGPAVASPVSTTSLLQNNSQMMSSSSLNKNTKKEVRSKNVGMSGLSALSRQDGLIGLNSPSKVYSVSL